MSSARNSATRSGRIRAASRTAGPRPSSASASTWLQADPSISTIRTRRHAVPYEGEQRARGGYVRGATPAAARPARTQPGAAGTAADRVIRDREPVGNRAIAAVGARQSGHRGTGGLGQPGAAASTGAGARRRAGANRGADGPAAHRAIQFRRARARADRAVRAADPVAADQPDRAWRGRQDPAGHRGRAALGSEGRPRRRRGVRAARRNPAAPAGGLGARLAPRPARTARRVLARVGAGRTQGTARAAAARRRRTLPRGGGRAGRGVPRLGPGAVHRGHQPRRARGAGRGVLGHPPA